MEKRMSRRSFSAGLLAAGAMALRGSTARASQGAQRGANERINVAVLGCRNRGWQVAGGLLATGGCRIVSLCDPDRAMIDVAVKQLGDSLEQAPALEKDFRRVLDDPTVDAIVVASPDHWHALQTLHSLQAGKHVFLEKPASYCIDEGKAMVRGAARHPKLTLCVGTQHRSGTHFREARQFIAEGGLGKVGFARAWMSHNRPVIPVIPDSDPPASLDYDLWLGPAPWRPYNTNKVHYNWHFMRDTGTNDTGNWGAHWLDTVRMLLDLGLPTAVSGTGGIRIVHDAKEWHDTQTTLFHYPDLTVLWEMRLWTRFGVQGMGGGVEIGGEKGSLVANRSGWTFHPKEGEPVRHPHGPMGELHFQNFVDCVRGQADPAAPIQEGHRSATLCHMANIVSDLQRTLRFDTEAERFIDDPQANERLGRPEYRAPWALPA